MLNRDILSKLLQPKTHLLRVQRLMLVLAAITFAVEYGAAQSIFPGAVGYGTESRGAYAGGSDPQILIVDTLYAGILTTGENRGSFEWAIKESYPRIILFEVGGEIDYSSSSQRNIYLNGSYCSIFGQTAPSPGITLKGSALSVKGDTHDVLFQHIAVRYGAYPKPDGVVSAQDCMTLLRGSYNIVIDHCSFSWSVDEIIGAYAKNFTISNSLLYEGLEYNYHANEKGEYEPERHGYGPIIASSSNFTSYNTLYAWFTNRLPKLAADTIAFINNYCTGHALFGPDLAKGSTGNNGVFIGNNFYPTPGITSERADNFTYWRSGLDASSKIYLEDNNCKGKDKGLSEIENIYADISESAVNAIFTDNPQEMPLDVSSYTVIPADSVIHQIIQNSGVRPWDRDYYDSIALKKLVEGNQNYINSPLALPARAYNRSIYEGLRSSAGNMSAGYDFSANNVSFVANGKTINLTQKTTSQNEVLSLLNDQLPNGVEAIDHPHELCQHIIIQTTQTGSDQVLTIEGDAEVFGIRSGTFHGEDAPYGNITYPSTRRSLQLPADPHGDDNNNGYTNFEEWVLTFSSDHVTENNPPANNKVNTAPVSDAVKVVQSHHSLTIKAPESAEVSLCDLAGRKIRLDRTSTANRIVYRSTFPLPSGMYVLVTRMHSNQCSLRTIVVF